MINLCMSSFGEQGTLAWGILSFLAYYYCIDKIIYLVNFCRQIVMCCYVTFVHCSLLKNTFVCLSSQDGILKQKERKLNKFIEKDFTRIFSLKLQWTRKHSSRMHTHHTITRMSSVRVALRLIVDRMTHACENITFHCGWS